MKGLGTLFLLLTTCLALRADDAATLPDIQVQENFTESLVRLTSLAEVATVLVYPCHWALLAKACVSWGIHLVHDISNPRGPSWPDCWVILRFPED